jgi:prophage DNA circulation protein
MATATRASYGGITFWAEDARGTQRRRIHEHRAFGRTGSDTEDTGADSRRDVITARMGYDAFKSLYKLVHQGKPKMFVHPIWGSWMARANIDDESITAKKKNKVLFTISLIEHKSAALATPQASKSVSSQQQELSAIFADADELVYDD